MALSKMKITDELERELDNVLAGSIDPHQKPGAQGVYTADLLKALNMVRSGNSQRLFWAMVAASDEYGLVVQAREELAYALGIKYNKGNMHIMLENLIDANMIAKVSNTFMINPFLVLPRTNIPKMRSALQGAWLNLVEFN